MAITEVTRRDILDYLILSEPPFHGRLGIVAFLNRIWDLSSMTSTDPRFSSAQGDINMHMITFHDWDFAYLLYEYLNMLGVSDEKFLTFLENCLHPVVTFDDKRISEMLEVFNTALASDGYQLEVSSYISERPVYKAVRCEPQLRDTSNDVTYEVVLSYAGEDREYVEEVANYLKKCRIKIFYDRYEEVALWGKDLSEHLDKVYRGGAKYCVMFISKSYADKVWTNHEKRSALARAILEKKEYILPARFDGTDITGLPPTTVYVDLSKKTPEELGKMILQKLGRLRH